MDISGKDGPPQFEAIFEGLTGRPFTLDQSQILEFPPRKSRILSSSDTDVNDVDTGVKVDRRGFGAAALLSLADFFLSTLPGRSTVKSVVTSSAASVAGVKAYNAAKRMEGGPNPLLAELTVWLAAKGAFACSDTQPIEEPSAQVVVESPPDPPSRPEPAAPETAIMSSSEWASYTSAQDAAIASAFETIPIPDNSGAASTETALAIAQRIQLLDGHRIQGVTGQEFEIGVTTQDISASSGATMQAYQRINVVAYELAADGSRGAEVASNIVSVLGTHTDQGLRLTMHNFDIHVEKDFRGSAIGAQINHLTSAAFPEGSFGQGFIGNASSIERLDQVVTRYLDSQRQMGIALGVKEYMTISGEAAQEVPIIRFIMKSSGAEDVVVEAYIDRSDPSNPKYTYTFQYTNAPNSLSDFTPSSIVELDNRITTRRMSFSWLSDFASRAMNTGARVILSKDFALAAESTFNGALLACFAIAMWDRFFLQGVHQEMPASERHTGTADNWEIRISEILDSYIKRWHYAVFFDNEVDYNSDDKTWLLREILSNTPDSRLLVYRPRTGQKPDGISVYIDVPPEMVRIKYEHNDPGTIDDDNPIVLFEPGTVFQIYIVNNSSQEIFTYNVTVNHDGTFAIHMANGGESNINNFSLQHVNDGSLVCSDMWWYVVAAAPLQRCFINVNNPLSLSVWYDDATQDGIISVSR